MKDAALILYEYVITLPHEIYLFWYRGFTATVILFFFARYVAIVYAIASLLLLNGRETALVCTIFIFSSYNSPLLRQRSAHMYLVNVAADRKCSCEAVNQFFVVSGTLVFITSNGWDFQYLQACRCSPLAMLSLLGFPDVCRQWSSLAPYACDPISGIGPRHGGDRKCKP